MKRDIRPRNPVAYAMGLRNGDGPHEVRRQRLLEEAAQEEYRLEAREAREAASGPLCRECGGAVEMPAPFMSSFARCEDCGSIYEEVETW